MHFLVSNPGRFHQQRRNDMRIISIDVNWFSTPENGDDYQRFTVGEGALERHVVEIKQHIPLGEGDKHYCEVIFEDGTSQTFFNVNKIYKKLSRR